METDPGSQRDVVHLLTSPQESRYLVKGMGTLMKIITSQPFSIPLRLQAIKITLRKPTRTQKFRSSRQLGKLFLAEG
jgi:hypothetical protein